MHIFQQVTVIHNICKIGHVVIIKICNALVICNHCPLPTGTAGDCFQSPVPCYKPHPGRHTGGQNCAALPFAIENFLDKEPYVKARSCPLPCGDNQKLIALLCSLATPNPSQLVGGGPGFTNDWCIIVNVTLF